MGKADRDARQQDFLIAPGAKGDPGPKGDTGAQGSRGSQGDTGEDAVAAPATRTAAPPGTTCPLVLKVK